MLQFSNQLLNESRLITVLYDNLRDEVKKDVLYSSVQCYVEKYVSFNGITAEKAIEIYTNYITTYNRHCKRFMKTGRYPLENGEHDFQMSREEYDVVLLLSVLFTPHRFRIMQAVGNSGLAEKALFIGLGSGLEIFLTQNKFQEIHGYDLTVSPFLFSEFTNVKLKAELYEGQYQNFYDVIYLVELLEHLEDPYELLATCCGSLKKGGRVLLTTATNIPQFDHFYNFPEDHLLFESKLIEMGFRIISKETITHNYLALELKPCNHFYEVEKL